MPSRKAVLLAIVVLPACRAHRPVVEIQPDALRESSLTEMGSIASALKITALSLPPQPYPYDRIEVDLVDPNLPDRAQHIESYKLNTPIPIKPHKNYTLTVRTYIGDDVSYSSEFCRSKKNFRSQLGISLLTISLCESPEEVEDPGAPPLP